MALKLRQHILVFIFLTLKTGEKLKRFLVKYSLTFLRKLTFQQKLLKNSRQTILTNFKALAQGLANATGISSYYKFEFSDSGMIIPPLPVGLDVGIWLRLHDTLSQLEEADILDQSQYRQITSSLPPIDKNKLNMLIEDTLLEKNQRVYALSALGELYKQLAEASFWEHKKDFIPAEVPPSEKAPKVKHKNNESNMLAFERKHGIGEKLLAIPFIASIRTNYYKKGGKTIKQCHITNADEKELVVQWGNNMGIINYVLNISTAQNEEQLQAACLEINDMLQLF